jgi:hypothetical protein
MPYAVNDESVVTDQIQFSFQVRTNYNHLFADCPDYRYGSTTKNDFGPFCGNFRINMAKWKIDLALVVLSLS